MAVVDGRRDEQSHRRPGCVALGTVDPRGRIADDGTRAGRLHHGSGVGAVRYSQFLPQRTEGATVEPAWAVAARVGCADHLWLVVRARAGVRVAVAARGVAEDRIRHRGRGRASGRLSGAADRDRGSCSHAPTRPATAGVAAHAGIRGAVEFGMGVRLSRRRRCQPHSRSRGYRVHRLSGVLRAGGARAVSYGDAGAAWAAVGGRLSHIGGSLSAARGRLPVRGVQHGHRAAVGATRGRRRAGRCRAGDPASAGHPHGQHPPASTGHGKDWPTARCSSPGSPMRSPCAIVATGR